MGWVPPPGDDRHDVAQVVGQLVAGRHVLVAAGDVMGYDALHDC